MGKVLRATGPGGVLVVEFEGENTGGSRKGGFSAAEPGIFL